MFRRIVLAWLMLAAAAFDALAVEVTGNRGIFCAERSEAAALRDLTARKDYRQWATAAGALMAAGRCVLLPEGTTVRPRAPAADGLAEVEAPGHAGPLWTEAGNIGIEVAAVLPDNMGDRRLAPAGVPACGELSIVVDLRRLRLENDAAAHAELVRRELAAARCRIFPDGASIVWQERKPYGLAIVREAGRPERLWIDEDVWRLQAAKAAPGGG